MLASALVVLAASLPYASAGIWRRATAAPKASSFAGSTETAVFPPPEATNSGPSFASFFPPASVVAFAGPTPTGDEAEELATATAVPLVTGAFPLLNPSTLDNKSTTFDVLKTWGNLAPMFSVDSVLPGASQLIPEGCELKQVHLVHRHGARYPTSGSAPSAFAAKLHNATINGTGFTASGDLAFLNTWTFKLGAEVLTPFGRQQLFDMGSSFRVKYGELLKNFTDLPVFRTTSEDRMVKSALNFAAGFFGIPEFLTDYNQVIMIENDGFNNTLAPYDTCTNANNAIGSFGSTQQNVWTAIYLKPALKRIQAQLKGVTLTTSDLFGMQQTCAYETVALGTSSFCDLFTVEEWNAYEYANDLNFWYGVGPGNPTSTAQGIGYVQELIARLTQTPLTEATTTTNSTITGSNITFPLNQPIFVDATHDVVISNIVVAMNFTSLAENGPLPTDHIPAKQSWITSQIAPFASQLVGQVMSCPAASATPTHIRWLLNDAVLPMTGIQGCKADKNGLCPLDTFITAMKARIAETDYNFDCLANYTIPSPDLIIDGRAPLSLH